MAMSGVSQVRHEPTNQMVCVCVQRVGCVCVCGTICLALCTCPSSILNAVKSLCAIAEIYILVLFLLCLIQTLASEMMIATFI